MLSKKSSLCLLFLFIGLAEAGVSWASTIYPSSKNTGIFYHKLLGAGFFKNSMLDRVESPGAKSIYELFRIAKSFRYTKDHLKDYWQSAAETSQKHHGDCEDKALWLYDQMAQNGYEDIHLIIGKYRPWDNSLHVWLTFQSAQETYLLDPTMQNKPWPLKRFSDGLYQPIHSFNHLRH